MEKTNRENWDESENMFVEKQPGQIRHWKNLTSLILVNIKTEPDKLETSACAYFKERFKTFPNLL